MRMQQTDVLWKDLGISATSCEFLNNELGFRAATAVQASTIPLLLAGKDAVVQAMTGSGKTLAYIVPIIERLLQKYALIDRIQSYMHDIHSIIVVPTRELGKQVHNVLQEYAKFVCKSISNGSLHDAKLYTMRILGGYDTTSDLNRYEQNGCHVLVATPGRLVELLSFTRGSTILRVAKLETLILDEADQLLSMGFGPQLDAIFSRLPKQRQTSLFSATQTHEVADLMRCGFRQPVMVNVQEQQGNASTKNEMTRTSLPQIPTQLENSFCIIRYQWRIDALLAFLSAKFALRSKILIYVLTCASADWLFTALKKLFSQEPIELYSLHGKQQSSIRNKTIRKFYRCQRGILVLTDVGARGLDIPWVDIVIQFDSPKNPLSFIHRIGRTARMGKPGISLTFFDPMETEAVEYFRQQNVNLKEVKLEGISENQEAEADQRRQLGSAVLKRGDRERLKKNQTRNQTKRCVVRTPVADTTCITKIREEYIQNPDFLKQATKAFVSFIKGYKQHLLKYIFRSAKLDVVDLCNGFCLFFIPNLTEIRHMERIEITVPEKFRCQVQLLRPKRVVQKLEKKRSVKNHKMEEAKNSDVSKGQRKQLFRQAHVDEIFQDAACLKKMKKGIVKEADFFKLTGFGKELMEVKTREQNTSNLQRTTDNAKESTQICSFEEEFLIDTAPRTNTQKKRRRQKKRR